MDSRIKDICYTMLPGKPAQDFGHVEFYNKLYKFRNEFWSDVLFSVFGDRRKLNGDDFIRQDVIGVLSHGPNIVGFQAYTFFDLRLASMREHSFITRYFDEIFMRRLADNDAKYVMSVEFFSMCTDWNSTKVGLSLGRVLYSLGLQIALNRGVDAVIAAARDDVPASSMSMQLGAECWNKGVAINGCPTDLVVFFPSQIQELKKPNELQLAQKLWREKVDLIDDHSNMLLKKIA